MNLNLRSTPRSLKEMQDATNLRRNNAGMAEELSSLGRNINNFKTDYFFLNNRKYAVLHKDDYHLSFAGSDYVTGKLLDVFVFRFGIFDRPKLVTNAKEAASLLSAFSSTQALSELLRKG